MQKGEERGFYILEYKAAPFTVILLKFLLHLYISQTTLRVNVEEDWCCKYFSVNVFFCVEPVVS